MVGLDDEPKQQLPPLSHAQKRELRNRAQQTQLRHEQLAARIVVDLCTLGGQAHLRGTGVTVAQVRAAWGEKGVYVNDILKRYRKLKRDDVEAALFHWNDPDTPTPRPAPDYVAEWAGPPRRKLYLEKLTGVGNGLPDTSWKLTATEFDDDGEELFYSDMIEDTFAAIVDGYPERYAPPGIVWRDGTSGEIVDIHALKAG